MPGRGGKRRRGQGKGGRGGGRGGSRGRGRPTKRKRKSASVEPGKERPAAQEEDSSEDESSDEEVRPTAYQRLVQSSRRDLQTVAALAATSTEHAGATKALDDPAAGNAKGGGDIGHGGSEGDLAAGAGSITLSSGRKMHASAPCVLVAKATAAGRWQVWVADPSRELQSLTIQIEHSTGGKPCTWDVPLPNGTAIGSTVAGSIDCGGQQSL